MPDDHYLRSSDPVLLVDWSDDHGRTWSNHRELPMGKIGEYDVRLKTERLGSSRNRVYRVTISDPVKRVILGAELRAEGGIS